MGLQACPQGPVAADRSGPAGSSQRIQPMPDDDRKSTSCRRASPASVGIPMERWANSMCPRLSTAGRTKRIPPVPSLPLQKSPLLDGPDGICPRVFRQRGSRSRPPGCARSGALCRHAAGCRCRRKYSTSPPGRNTADLSLAWGEARKIEADGLALVLQCRHDAGSRPVWILTITAGPLVRAVRGRAA